MHESTYKGLTMREIGFLKIKTTNGQHIPSTVPIGSSTRESF